jgi:uncharacterized membrane protein YoaK (UPF0700 family)
MENKGENKINQLKVEEEAFLECEKRWVFALLMLVGGFFGGFTYTIRGGIFCNAQTGNVVLFAIALGNGSWSEALYYVIPISAYLLGALLSESAGYYIKKLHVIRWDTMFIIVEIVAVIALGLLPETAPYQITQVAVNFICSMQFNTFRQAQGIPMATTFCTNHIRQVGIAASKLMRHHGGKVYAERMFFHLKMLGMFVIGVVSAVLLCKRFLGHAMFFALIPLSIILADLLYADIKLEHGQFESKPRGH